MNPLAGVLVVLKRHGTLLYTVSFWFYVLDVCVKRFPSPVHFEQ